METKPLGEFSPTVYEAEIASVIGEQALKFYSFDSQAEAERLRKMSELADEFSLNAITSYLGSDLSGRTIVDVGAGDSSSLGQELYSRGARYLAVDQREAAIQAQRSAGLEGVHSSATDVGLESNLADVVHSRFTFGWLSPEQRKAAFKEMVRLAKPNAEIVIIDYDWGQIDGPNALLDATDEAVSTLKMFGFDPNYGNGLPSDCSKTLIPSVEGDTIKLFARPAERGPITKGNLENCLPILQQTAQSMFDYLEQTGDYDRLHVLQNKLTAVEQYSASNSDEPSRLADVVVQRVLVDKAPQQEEKSFIEVDQGGEVFREGVDFERIAKDEKSVLYHTVLAKSQRLIDAARRVQAESYVHDGIVSKEFLEGGLLSEEIDSEELVARSKYFVSLDDSHCIVRGCVRSISSDSTIGAESLPSAFRNPVVKTYVESSGHPIEDVIEISALAKNFSRGSIEDVVKAVVAMSIYSRDQGLKLAIMELNSSRVNLIKTIFGADNFYHIEEESSDGGTINLSGVNQKVRFIDLSTDVPTFCDNILNNSRSVIAQANSLGKRPSRIAQLIVESLS